MTEKQVQRCMAYLELARTAIDNAELKLVGADESERPALAYIKASSEIAAASGNLKLCIEEIVHFAEECRLEQTSASAANRSTA